jgi:hypothetical protein
LHRLCSETAYVIAGIDFKRIPCTPDGDPGHKIQGVTKIQCWHTDAKLIQSNAATEKNISPFGATLHINNDLCQQPEKEKSMQEIKKSSSPSYSCY